MNVVSPDSGMRVAALVQLGSGFFVGAASAELQVVAFATIDRSATGGASTLFNVQRQVGAALGVAVTASVPAVGGEPDLGTYHAGMLVSAGFALAGVVLALRIRDRAAEPEVAAEPRTAVAAKWRSRPPRGRQGSLSMVRLALINEDRPERKGPRGG